MASKIWRNLIRTAAAVCFVAGSGAQAGGVFYQSDFDPYHFIVKNILWVNSTVNGTDSSGCLSGQGWTYTSSLWNPGSVRNQGCNVTLYSSVATLNSTLPSGDVAYIDFVEAPTAPSTTSDPSAIAENIVLAIYVEAGNLAGVLWAPVLVGPEPSVTEENDPYCLASLGGLCTGNDADLQGSWKVRFGNNLLDLLVPPIEPPFDAYAFLYHEGPCTFLSFLSRANGCYNYEDYAVLQTSENNADRYGDGYQNVGTTFPTLDRSGGVIPEPGSLALLGGALVAGWITRRRKTVA
jgi:hypothetical protein